MSDEETPKLKPTGKISTDEPSWGGRATTADVIAEIQQRAQRYLPLYARLLDELPPVRIFNIFSERWTVAKGSIGTFTIPECEDWAVCSRPLEIPAVLREE